MERIHFVSAVPGAGKTYWAINKILEQAAKKDSLVMYVAPTIKLLEEVFYALRFKNPKNLCAGIVSGSGAVESLIAHLVGGVVGDKITYSPVQLGTILLLTHEAFARVPVIPRSKEIVVFFDEARKLVANYKVKTNETIFEEIGGERILTLEKMQNSAFFKIHNVASRKVLHVLKKSANAQNLYSIDLATRAINKRMEIYVDKYARNIFEVVLPSKVFQGFKKVYLMAADFENSQMRHILEKENFELVHLRANISKEREKLLLDRYKNTVIYPLSHTDKPISKYALSGVMVVDNRKQELLEKIINAGSTVRDEATIVNKHKTDFALKDKLGTSVAWKYFIKGLVKTNVFDYYYNTAVSAAKKLDGLREDERFKHRPILVANKGYGDEYKDDRNFPSNNEFAEDEYNAELETIRLPGNPQGLNRFMRYSTMIYLMAVNPPPALIKFFHFYIPNYSYEKDYAGNNALQAVTRTSIRDANSTKTVRIIVSDFGMAKIIKSMLMDKPTISSKFVGDFVPLQGESKPRKIKDREEVAKNQAAAKKRWHEKNAELNRLSAKLRRLVCSSKKGKIYEYQIKMLEDQIQAIKRKKSKNTK